METPRGIGTCAALGAALLAFACGGGASGGGGSGHPVTPPATSGTALRWVPVRATYAFTAPDLRVAQRGVRDLVDALGTLTMDLDASIASRWMVRNLGVDLFSEAAVAELGLDVAAPVALYSEALGPTLAVHLADAEHLRAFLDERRAHGMRTTSVLVDGIEVFAVKPADIPLSYAIDGDWLWVHVGVAVEGHPDDGKAWFHATHTTGSASPPTPDAAWDWARGAVGGSAAGIVGFADPNAMFAAAGRALASGRACAALLAPVSRVAFGLAGDGTRIDGRIALDAGAAAGSIAKLALPLPAAWDAASKDAPLGVQWNLDLFGLRAWAAPCLAIMGTTDFDDLDQYGVRGGRATLFSFDVENTASSSIAVSANLTTKRFFADQLEGIPLRSSLEKRHTYGPYQGASLSVPFMGSIEYVLTDTVGLGALGGDLLARMVGTGPAVPGALARLDVRVDALPTKTWTALFEQLTFGEEGSARAAAALAAWHEAHVALSLHGSSLVLEASAVRN